MEPLALDLPIGTLQADLLHHLRGSTTADLPAAPPGALSGLRMERASDQRTLTFRGDSAFLSAEGGGDSVGLFRPEAAGWESFLPVSQADLEVLHGITGASWLVRSTGGFADRPLLADEFRLRAADLEVDLRFQMPLDRTDWPSRVTLLRDGWRIEQICRYRPLVYYTVFGDLAAREQLALSVRSLFQVGHYHGDVAVLSDLAPAEIVPFLPSGVPGNFILASHPARDTFDARAARYTIGDWSDAAVFQPLFYVDTATIFDADVTPLLHALAMSDRLGAPAEILPALARSLPAAAGLLQLDDCPPQFRQAFDAGALGIPNMKRHGGPLALICRVLANSAVLHGRHLPFAVQEIANYVATRRAPFDTGLLSSFVRHVEAGSDPVRRTGLAQFHGRAAAERTAAMRDYLRQIEGVV
ncbi:MAG: hypothetical protein WDN25_17885 [Acetobacteraceae bacterium]